MLETLGYKVLGLEGFCDGSLTLLYKFNIPVSCHKPSGQLLN